MSHGMDKTAQLEFNSLGNRQPVQLDKRLCNMVETRRAYDGLHIMTETIDSDTPVLLLYVCGISYSM